MRLLGGGDPIKGADLNELENEGTLGIEIVGRESRPTAISRAVAKGLGEHLRSGISGTPLSHWYGTAAIQLTSTGPHAGGHMTGLNIVVRTKLNDFLMSDADREQLLHRGGWGDAEIARHAQREERGREAALAGQHAREQQRAEKPPGAWTLSDTASAVGDALGGAIGSAAAPDVMHIPELAYMRGSINFGVGRRVNGSMQYITDFGNWFMDDDAAGYTAGRDFLLELRSFEWLFRAIGALTIPAVEEEE